MVQAILNDKGEGVVLRKPRSQYDHGRSFSLLKIKVGNKKRKKKKKKKVKQKARNINVAHELMMFVDYGDEPQHGSHMKKSDIMGPQLILFSFSIFFAVVSRGHGSVSAGDY